MNQDNGVICEKCGMTRSGGLPMYDHEPNDKTCLNFQIGQMRTKLDIYRASIEVGIREGVAWGQDNPDARFPHEISSRMVKDAIETGSMIHIKKTLERESV
jgi:hypothetical protein